jgi:FkbM family methyltransferase
MIRRAAKRALRKGGFELSRYRPGGTYLARRMERIAAESIDLVVDVGAHAGEFAHSLRHEGYDGRILSFEPQAQMFGRLCTASEGDRLWECRQEALGAAPDKMTLHISGNDGFSSSLLPMTEAHEHGEPTSAYVDAEEVTVNTLDTVLAEQPGERLFLKIDVQGHEAEALAGGATSLARCRMVELELGLIELYEGQPLFNEMVASLEQNGLAMVDVESGFNDSQTGRLLQVDAIFARLR